MSMLLNGPLVQVENMRVAVSLHFAHYNFARLHRVYLGTAVTPV
jgi:hypothetical protein